MIETFQRWCEHPEEYARAWKGRTGGKVLGVLGPGLPEEILVAARILPFRIQDDLSLLSPACDFLDGVLGPPGDRAFDNLPAAVSFRYPLPLLPDRQNAEAPTLLSAHLAAFQKSIEDWCGNKINAADLDRSIAVLNDQRRLLRSVWEIRKKEPPPLTGLESLFLTASSRLVDKLEHSRVLAEVLEKELPGRRPVGTGRVRLMLLGSEARAAQGLGLVESLDAVVVVDHLGNGAPYFRNEVIPGEDRLAAIAASFLERSRPGPPEQVPHLARDWRVQGALILPGPDYAPHAGDLPALRRALDGSGVPSLVLEPDDDPSLNRSKIRLAAFLDSLRPEDLF